MSENKPGRHIKPGWAMRLALRVYPPDPPMFFSGGRGHARVFLSATDCLAYQRGYDRWPLAPENVNTPEAQGFFDREQEALFA